MTMFSTPLMAGWLPSYSISATVPSQHGPPLCKNPLNMTGLTSHMPKSSPFPGNPSAPSHNPKKAPMFQPRAIAEEYSSSSNAPTIPLTLRSQPITSLPIPPNISRNSAPVAPAAFPPVFHSCHGLRFPPQMSSTPTLAPRSMIHQTTT